MNSADRANFEAAKKREELMRLAAPMMGAMFVAAFDDEMTVDAALNTSADWAIKGAQVLLSKLSHS